MVIKHETFHYLKRPYKLYDYVHLSDIGRLSLDDYLDIFVESLLDISDFSILLALINDSSFSKVDIISSISSRTPNVSKNSVVSSICLTYYLLEVKINDLGSQINVLEGKLTETGNLSEFEKVYNVFYV